MHLYQYTLLFLHFFVYENIIASNGEINDGSALITKADLNKHSWNDEQMDLLRARLIYQDILPKTTLVDLKSDEFLNELLNYFNLAIDQVKSLTDGETQRTNLMAMCDVLGGYFRSNLIPLTKRAFYSGNINYETTKQVEKFYNDIKLFLHTDGRNWPAPSTKIMKKFIQNPQLPSPNKFTRSFRGRSCDHISFTNDEGYIYIPTPFFDSTQRPTAIALPFKENPLRNLDHENAIYCLSNFYSIAKNCLRERKASDDNVRKFISEFDGFLTNNVYPHLTDEKIYPAFGGIFQIKNEINKRIMKRESFPCLTAQQSSTEKPTSPETALEYYDDDEMGLVIILISVCAASVFWLGLAICFRSNGPSIFSIGKGTGASSGKGTGAFSGKGTGASIGKYTGGTADKRTGGSRAPSALKSNEFVVKKKPITSRSCLICHANSIQYGPKSSPKPCPKCKKKHCRCVTNIWSNLSNCTITYPRIFPQKNTATSGLLTKHLEIEANDQTAVSLCPQCKIPDCKHLNKFAEKVGRDARPQNHFMVEMASNIPKGPARNIHSAPVTAGKNTRQAAPQNINNTRSNSGRTESNEKVFVFGYNFETSSDDTSCSDDSY